MGEMAVHAQTVTSKDAGKRAAPGGVQEAEKLPDTAAKKVGSAILQKWELLIIILTVAP